MIAGSYIQARFRGKFGSFNLDACFEVPARGVTALFGHSGSGKTTVLRCMAGLSRVADGYFSIDNDIWQDEGKFKAVHARPLGYVFQEASLFPHLNVRANLLYGTKGQGARPDLICFDEVVELLGLARLLERYATKLSGGERQRVAIGRALLAQPKLLLMDEPLSGLDKFAKDEILPFLERLHETLALPVVYVSHDIGEIERLADQLILMERGSVLAVGPIRKLQSDPSLPLIGSREAAFSLDAIVESFDPAYGLATLSVDGGAFLAPSPGAYPGERRRLRILAGDISLARERPNQSTIINIQRVRILSVTETGEFQMTAVLGLGSEGRGAQLLARVTRRSWDLLELEPGLDVYAQVKGVALERRGYRPS